MTFADLITQIVLSPASKHCILLIHPFAFALITDEIFFFHLSVLLTSARSSLLIFYISCWTGHLALGSWLCWPAEAFQAWTEAASVCDSGQGHNWHKKMRTRRFIILLGRSAYPARSRTSANFSPFPSLSRSLTLPFVSCCLCVCHSVFP